MSARWMLVLALLSLGLLGGNRPETPLRVGFGSADVSPDLSRPNYLAGFGKNRKATKIHDPLMARAVVLADGDRKIALVSVDVIGLFNDSVEKVRGRIKGIEYLLVSSTHTHHAPDTLGLWGPNLFTTGVDPAFIRRIEDGIVQAIEKADAALVPVSQTRLGSAKDPELLHDSRKPIVKHDELTAIQFTGPTKKIVGTIVTWNSHPEAIHRNNTEASADFVASTVKYLESKYDAPVLYLTGTVGGLMSPLTLKVKDEQGRELEDGSFEATEHHGRAVGRLTEKALAGGRVGAITPFTIQRQEIYLPIDNNGYKIAFHLGVVKRQSYGWSGDPLKPAAVDKSDPKQRLAIKTEIARLRLGELDVAAIPGEIYPELVLGQYQEPVAEGADFPDAPLEPSIYGQLDAPFKMIVGLANDELGYIIPKRQWDDRPPYCYGRKTSQYGEVNSLGSETAPLICGAFKELVKRK